MNLGLENSHAIVTGGTRGIGYAIVGALSEEGCTVSFCARNERRVNEVERSLREGGGNVHGASVDVTNKPALYAWIEACAAREGGIDVVVANVSALATAPELESWRAGFETDILGTAHTVEAALPYIRNSKIGSIVIVSSTAALEIYAGERPYSGIKAALTAYASGLAQQHASAGIRVNAVSPGAVYFEGGEWQRIERERPEAFADMLSRNPLGRMGKTEEIANAVAFIASPRASFITGTNLVVDGGLTKRIHY